MLVLAGIDEFYGRTDVYAFKTEWLSPCCLPGFSQCSRQLIKFSAGNFLRGQAKSQSASEELALPKPLFVDPDYHGSCDPEIVFNPSRQRWYLIYTARRAKRDSGTHVGTPIGVISSADFRDWKLEGHHHFIGKRGRPDNNDTLLIERHA